MVEQDTIKLLRECDAGIKMGMTSIDEVLPYVGAESLKKAIDTYSDKNIILIFGGKNKGGNFEYLNSYDLKKKICFGELSKEVKNIDLNYKNYFLEDCVKYALSNARENDVILFSCGCSSFDLFNNFKERGEAFNKLVSEYKNI